MGRKAKTAEITPETGMDEEKDLLTSQLTPEELAIAKRVMTEGDDYRTPISEEEAIDFSLSEDPMKLPKSAQIRQDRREYCYRWITRTPSRVDEMRSRPRPLKWWICNRTTTPYLKDFMDPVLGCVCRLDQVLVFKPWADYALEKRAKMELATAADRNLTRKDKTAVGPFDMQATERREGEGKASRAEIKGDDVVVYDESSTDMTELTE